MPVVDKRDRSSAVQLEAYRASLQADRLSSHHQNITVDGVVENDGSWFDPSEDSDRGRELAAVAAEHAAASDGFLVGRTTLEEMGSFWPQLGRSPPGRSDR
jgi:hypothetical protein